jgi:aminoglycoside 2'-N-acetyltransferase I
MKQESAGLRLEVVEGRNLSPDKQAALVGLCQRAYKDDEDEDVEALFKTYPDPTHAIAYLGSTMVSHALWVTRWLSANNGPLLRTAFVEMVATEPQYAGRGFASAVMERVAREITDYELGGLWPNYPAWYARLGWEWWRGPLFIRRPEGLLPTPDDQIMIMRLPKTPPLDLDGPLSAEWREGELW